MLKDNGNILRLDKVLFSAAGADVWVLVLVDSELVRDQAAEEEVQEPLVLEACSESKKGTMEVKKSQKRKERERERAREDLLQVVKFLGTVSWRKSCP